jgi:EAL domain-containing protein (putative c-di-GMP-specific phosphodiesterase class I)
MINREMLKAIISLGRGIGAKVIAEGIELPEELKTVRTLGVDYGQGFLLGRPDLMAPPSS